MRRVFMSLLGLLAVLSLAVAPGANAQGASEAPEACRQLDEVGTLARLGITRGECVNVLKGPASENANNFIAGICGGDEVFEKFGFSNKGQCVKAFKDFQPPL